MFFVARFTSSQPSTPVRNATNLRTFCFRDYLPAFRETCQNQRVLCSLIYIGPAVNSREECKVQENLSSHEKNIWLYSLADSNSHRENHIHKDPVIISKAKVSSRESCCFDCTWKSNKNAKGAKSIISSPEQLGWPKKGTDSGNENAEANFCPCAVMRYVI